LCRLARSASSLRAPAVAAGLLHGALRRARLGGATALRRPENAGDRRGVSARARRRRAAPPGKQGPIREGRPAGELRPGRNTSGPPLVKVADERARLYTEDVCLSTLPRF